MTRDDREYLRNRAADQRRAREERKEFERQNQPRDAEEERNAAAEDKHFADNFDALLNQAARMSDKDFEKAVSQGSFKKKMKKAGTNKSKLTAARKKKKNGICAIIGIVLLFISIVELYMMYSGVQEMIASVVP